MPNHRFTVANPPIPQRVDYAVAYNAQLQAGKLLNGAAT